MSRLGKTLCTLVFEDRELLLKRFVNDESRELISRQLDSWTGLWKPLLPFSPRPLSNTKISTRKPLLISSSDIRTNTGCSMMISRGEFNL